MLVNLTEVLDKAQKNNYAVGLFNTTDTDMLQAAIEVAEELRSPIIIGTAEILLPYGSLELIAPSMIAAAERASVPVVVHYDHGLTFEKCITALKLGFSSIMFDGSASPYQENIAQTREIIKIAHSFGATVEGEIGHVGNATANDCYSYTTADDAINFISDTNVDALAIAIGTAHGVYKEKPTLDIERLAEIHSAVNTPLVLHGGSGLSNNDFSNCIKNGIAKVNIFTDLCIAGEQSIKQSIENNVGYLELRNRKVNAIKEIIKTKILLFGSANMA